MTKRRTLDKRRQRQLAVEADVDPRTIMRVLNGEPVRAGTGERARSALERAGLL